MNKRFTEAVCIIFSLTCGVACFGQVLLNETDDGDVEDHRLGMVFEMERPRESDLLILRNGDRLLGTILNDGFGIRTSYAQLNFSNRLVAGIDFEGGENNIEAIVTVNNNRFSGYLDDQIFSCKLNSGPLVQVRREKISKAVFHVREEERDVLPQNQFLELKNGDYFSGKVLNRMITVETSYGEVPVKLDTVDSITISEGNFPVVKVSQTNENVVQGMLKTEDIEVMLDVGSMVKIYHDRVKEIRCQAGTLPEIARASGSGTGAVAVQSLDQLMARFIGSGPASSGLGIGTVPGESPFAGALKKGDVIESINGEPYAKGMLSASAKSLMSGEVSSLTFGIRRGDQTFSLQVTKE